MGYKIRIEHHDKYLELELNDEYAILWMAKSCDGGGHFETSETLPMGYFDSL